jgi:hypothetical protein
MFDVECSMFEIMLRADSLGSARVARAGDSVLATADFSLGTSSSPAANQIRDPM